MDETPGPSGRANSSDVLDASSILVMFETTPREIFDLSPTRDGTITLTDTGVDQGACQGATLTLGTCSTVDQIRQV